MILFLGGCYLGVAAGDIFRRWEINNKEPSPELVRDRKELIATLFIVVCLAILYGGILRNDLSWGLGLVGVSIVPVIFLSIELTQPRNKEGPRGYNALAYFIANVVCYALARALYFYSGEHGNMNNISSNWFVLTVIVTFVIDVIFTLCVGYLAHDTESEEDFKRAVPVYLRSYVLMLALTGILLIFRA
jgi:hypothetical protein